ncbi:helix-hairpin-helix domain-containing protein, partial [Methylobacterium sp. WL2]
MLSGPAILRISILLIVAGILAALVQFMLPHPAPAPDPAPVAEAPAARVPP